MNEIGIIQGRLSPPLHGKIQAFPAGTWKEEFPRAQAAGLGCIEWIFEKGTEAENPLGTREGIRSIRDIVRATGVQVTSICADHYMEEPLIGMEGDVRNPAWEHLRWLIGRAGKLDAHHIVLPFVDSSSLLTRPNGVETLIHALEWILPAAEENRVEIHLETDLPPREQDRVLSGISHPLVRSNYDTGNAAALGHDPAEELAIIGPWLGSVHIKDRVRGGGSVPLGRGSADFLATFSLFMALGYRGTYILQTARETGLDEVELAIRNRQFVQDQLLRASRFGPIRKTPASGHGI
jgi:hexulose-6-phosphate isomerase